MKSKYNSIAMLSLLSMVCGAPAKKAAGTKPAVPEKEDPKEKEKTDLAKTPDINFEEDEGAGSDSMGKDDLAIPRLTILQALSPACQKKKEGYIEGAEPGEILDTVSSELFSGDDGILFIPCTYRKTHIEWKPRNAGGGFVADLGENPSVLLGCGKDEKGHWLNAAGNTISPTAEYFGFRIDETTGQAFPYVLSMAGAQIKHSKKWNTLINTYRVDRPGEGGGKFNPAMFFAAYRLTTSPESNNEGDWFAWNIKLEANTIDLPNGSATYVQCREFRKSVMQGDVKASKPESNSSNTATEEDSAPM